MNIHIYDEFGPEDIAMMQALYSRSSKSVTEHAKKVQESGSGNFMERFYVGYGHASIADCGSTTLFIEGVSMLAAKAIQDWPLYSGQETSSRYINMAEQAIVDPVGSAASKKILADWLDFYTRAQDPLVEYLISIYPRKQDEDEKVYDKAIKARAFDILRGFLPAGVTTQLSWHTNLRQAHDKIEWLRHHPLLEVRNIAVEMKEQLAGKYKHSFGHKLYVAQEHYRKEIMKTYAYFVGKKVPNGFAASTTIRNADLKDFAKVLKTRPVKTTLPHILNELGNVCFETMIDFGSFRDLQRHRNGVCRMPRLGTQYGFESWYLDALSPTLRKEARALIAKQRTAIKQLKATPEERQYYCAMGFLVSAKITYALPAALYVMELRSGTLVHPTLRTVAHRMYAFLKKRFPEIALHPDLEQDAWNIRRGSQDIVEK